MLQSSQTKIMWSTGVFFLFYLMQFGMIQAVSVISAMENDTTTAENIQYLPFVLSRFSASQPDLSDMVFVPAGEFMMGMLEEGFYIHHYPARTIYLSDYFIGRTEVTNAEYHACVSSGACTDPQTPESWSREFYYGNPIYDNYPVVSVNWYQAKTYCEWHGFSIPTEAQWEKAARGTDGRRFPWGDNPANCDLANHRGLDEDNDGYADVYCVGDTNEVGQYPEGATPYGALDMAGNVKEWTADWYGRHTYSGTDTVNPVGPAEGEAGITKVLRGGSWSLYDTSILTARRDARTPNSWGTSFGVRCAYTLPE